MRQDDLQVHGRNIYQGSIEHISIELAKPYDLPASIPIQVIRVKRAGPTLFVSAAIHGDELNSGKEVKCRINI